MDAIQTIQQQVSKYLAGNEIYSSYEKQWTYLFESYMGASEYRTGQHLYKYMLETNNEYTSRLNNTPYENHCSSIISVYNSFLFKTPPLRDLNSLSNLSETEDFLKDADMDGRSFNNFMKDVSTYASIFGHTWCMLVKPNVGAVSRGEELGMSVRPYLCHLSPLVVLDWQYSRSTSGAYVIDYFKYVEDINGSVTTVREWTPDLVKTIVIDTESETIMDTTVETNNLGKVPVVCAYNRRSMTRGIGISDIADIADASRFIYNALSELDTSIRLDSHPSLAKTESTLAGNGPGSIIQMPEDLDPGLKPYVVQASGANIDSILKSIEHTIDSIDKMANTGSVRARESRTISGVAMEVEFNLLSARVSEKGNNLELVEEQIWKMFAEYQGVTYDCEIEYPQSYNIRDEHKDLDFLIKASNAGITDPEYIAQVQGQIADIVIKDEAVAESIKSNIENISGFVPHYMTNEATGDTVYTTTQAQHEYLLGAGYTEQ